jgi:hypothetical protein
LAFGLLLFGLRRNEDDSKETPVPEKSVPRHKPPSSEERDTMPAIEPQLLRDQLEALLSSPEGTYSKRKRASGDAEPAESDGCDYEDDTEPSIDIDARFLRDAILAAGKSA